jgi:3-deoxy-D-manno-octulosonic-acid transferase
MLRLAYNLLWGLALPLLPARLWWRARREPGYRIAIGERFGRYPTPPPAGEVIWLHAVSVGETRAAAPLVQRLQREFPAARLLLTGMTAAGRDAARSLYGDAVLQAWLPYDLPFAVNAFLDHFRPRFGLIMETELWPNLAAAASRKGVPLYLVNARLSSRSAAGYARVEALTRPMLASLAGIAAQTRADAERLSALGAREVAVTGNLKFDVAVPDAMRRRGAELRARIGRRPVWLAASTREGEEALILDALGRRPLPPGTLMLLVPRHPQRFDEVFALVRERGLSCARRSHDDVVAPGVQVLLGDTMGEMFAYCAAADVAFVGGSLLPLGGQNLIEPIALGVPTLVGPHTFNFLEATQKAIAAGAAIRVADADELLAAVASLLADEGAREAMRNAALEFVGEHAGATDRLWQWLEPRLARATAGSPAGPPG